MARDPDPERDAGDGSASNLPPKLVKFRQITGINTTGTLKRTRQYPRPGDNIGIYARIIKEEKAAHRTYTIVNFLIESTFMSQIAIAAALTALGASNASHVAITALGSVNTVIAGVQTYLKGQGLPTRVQQYEFGLRKLREHIEDLERHFTQADCKKEVEKELAEIDAMYHSVRQTAEDNTPDTYKAMVGAGAKLLTKAHKTDGQVLSTEVNEDTGVPSGEEDSEEETEAAKAPKPAEAKAANGKAGPSTSDKKDDTETTPLLKKD